MSGNKSGGIKARDANYERHGKDFYKIIGAKGGRVRNPNGGFGCKEVGEDGLTGRERARLAGAIGGRLSKRGPAKKKDA